MNYPVFIGILRDRGWLVWIYMKKKNFLQIKFKQLKKKKKSSIFQVPLQAYR